ncbi:hypothetical protein F7725_021351 [Dissostichus mawsoni]|uniref:Uncharacterized protein n=1 Tax=Dissostichus mawsoni TaxID=36200 RepID=A0A7J5ZAX2_DISMA|nr:hypothetical protein F7725_021351 [Dissostichus mawsoni]
MLDENARKEDDEKCYQPRYTHIITFLASVTKWIADIENADSLNLTEVSSTLPQVGGLPSEEAPLRSHQGSYDYPQARPEPLLSPGVPPQPQRRELHPDPLSYAQAVKRTAGPTLTTTTHVPEPTHTPPHDELRDIQQMLSLLCSHLIGGPPHPAHAAWDALFLDGAVTAQSLQRRQQSPASFQLHHHVLDALLRPQSLCSLSQSFPLGSLPLLFLPNLFPGALELQRLLGSILLGVGGWQPLLRENCSLIWAHCSHLMEAERLL